MASRPINQNLAIIVHRLLTDRRGWRVERLMDELDIAPRTYRKYRQILSEQFDPFFDDEGESLLEEVEFESARYLRLRHDASALTHTDLPTQIAALHFARNTLHFLDQTDLGDAAEDLLESMEDDVRERHAATHMLRNLDRLLHFVPDAPKNYVGKTASIRKLLTALFSSKRVEITYDAANSGRFTRLLEPLSLVSWRSALYLLAREPDDDTVKTYAIDRVSFVKVHNAYFTYPSSANFSPSDYTGGGFGIFHDHDAEPQYVELIFEDIRWLKIYLRERRWHATQQFELLHDGRLRMTFEVEGMAEVWPWIRSFGEDVEVVEPAGEVPRGYSDQ